jgi:3-oxoadipate enol-lactonase
LRGEDDCFALRQRFGLRDLVEDLSEFLAWHYLERPIIFGVSFGGAIALEYAAAYPPQLSQLIVQGVGAHFERGLLQQVAGSVLTRFPLPSDNPFINQFFNVLFGGRQEPGPLFDFVTGRCWQTDQSVMAYRFRMVEQYDISNRLGAIRAPTLVLAGNRDVLMSDASLRQLRDGISHCQLVRLSGCGHLASVAKPERVAEEAFRFLSHHVGEHATDGGRV